MNDVQSRYQAAVGGLVLAAIALGLSIWLAGGYVSGGLAIVTVAAAVHLGKVAGERRKVRGELQAVATDLGALLAKRSELGERLAGDAE